MPSTQRSDASRLFGHSPFAGVVSMVCLLATGLLPAHGALLPQLKNNNMQLTSTAFQPGNPIPAKHTCDGQDISPQLNWTNVPPETKSLALIADDPDAPMGTWVHWVLYDLPPATTGLSEAIPKSPSLANGAKQGLNDFRRPGYGGPCPPPGKPHRYYFKLYALDTPVNLNPGATKKELERAMENHILAQAQVMGTYQRK